MKRKISWALALIPFIITSIFLVILPEQVNIHFGLDGTVDNTGSKYILWIFPFIIFSIFALMKWIIKRADQSSEGEWNDKRVQETKNNNSIFETVLIVLLIFMNIMCYYVLFLAYSGSDTLGLYGIDFYALSTILISVAMIIFGNLMPKSRRNGSFGLRTSWTQYNEHVWHKSNYYGGIMMMVTGFVSVLLAVFVGGWQSELMMVVLIILCAIVSIVISHKVYRKEKEKADANN